jgi:hypothetical protein
MRLYLRQRLVFGEFERLEVEMENTTSYQIKAVTRSGRAWVLPPANLTREEAGAILASIGYTVGKSPQAVIEVDIQGLADELRAKPGEE